MRRTPLRPNPLRPGTPTMLPDDAGAFQFLSPTQKIATEGRGWFKLPSGRTVKVKQIGKGHASTAYLGEDGWVYLLTQPHARDPAKEVLTEIVQSLAPGDPATKHLPWIEHVGYVEYDWPNRGRSNGRYLTFGTFNLHRMPLYSKLPARSAASTQRMVLERTGRSAFESTPLRANAHGRLVERDYHATRWALVEQVQKAALAGTIPASLAAAVTLLSERLDDYEDGWVFEFPARNLMVDEAGNLVLLDVIFNGIGLAQQRKELAARAWR